jgi:hypothetical protein
MCPKEQRRAVVIGDYPELGPYSPNPGQMGLLNAATAALAKEFNGTIIDDYYES